MSSKWRYSVIEDNRKQHNGVRHKTLAYFVVNSIVQQLHMLHLFCI